MSQDRSDDEGERPSSAPSAPSSTPDIPDLLPKGFRGEQTARGARARLDAVSLARADRDVEVRKQTVERRQRRGEARARQKRVDASAARLERLASGLIAGVVVGAPVMIGAVHLITILPLLGLALMAAGCTLAVCRQRGKVFRGDLMGWSLLAISALTFLQAIPLPFALVDLLSPGIGAWIEHAFGSTSGGPPSTATLGLNPGEAARAGFGLLTATALYFAAFNLYQEKSRFQKMLLLLPACGVLLVVVGVLQKVMGARELLFFYQPRDLDELPFFSSTFVNPNHLATLLGLSSFAPLSLSLSEDYKEQRGGLLTLFAICSVGMVMTLSATALLSWIIGLVAFGVLTIRRRFSSRQSFNWLALTITGTLALGAYAAWSQLADRVAFLAKHQGLPWFRPTILWGEGLHLARQHPWLGFGPGGFSDAFATTERHWLPGRYEYVSNTYLQLALDYGLPIGVLASLVLATAVLPVGLRRGWKREDLPVMTGLFAAFVFLGFDSSLGFSLEIPGVLLPAVFLLALARGRDDRYHDLTARGILRRRKVEEPSSDEPDLAANDPDAPAPGTGEEPGEPKLGEPKLGEPKLGEPKLGEPKLGEPKLGEPKLGEPKLGEPKLGREAGSGDEGTGGRGRRRSPEESQETDEMGWWRRGLPLWGMAAVTAVSMVTLPAAMDAATGGASHALRRLATEARPDPAKVNALARETIAQRPVYSPTHMMTSMGHRAAGQEALADAALARAQDFDKGNPAPWLLAGQVLLERGKPRESLAAYTTALRLSLVTNAKGRDAIALEISQVFKEPAQVAEAMPDSPAVWSNLLDTLMRRRQAGRVIDIAAALMARFPGHPETRVIQQRAAEAEAALGRWDRARALATALMKPEPGLAAAHVILTRAALHEGDPVKALALAEAGLRFHGRDPALLFVATETLVEHREAFGGREGQDQWRAKVDRLLQDLRPFAIQRPDLRYRFYRLSALNAIERGLTPTAIRDLRRALEIDPDDGELTYLLVDMLHQERQVAETIETATRALERFPDHPSAAQTRELLDRLQALKKTRDDFR